MNLSLLKTLLPGILFLLCLSLSAQNKKQLEKKRDDLNKKIEQTNRLLKETQQTKKEVSSKLNMLSGQIQLREELIGTISQEIGTLDYSIEERNRVISKKNRELSELKAQYARMLQTAQLRRSKNNKLLFIFASKDFNQAFRRIQYLQQYSEYRKKQARLIEEVQTSLSTEVRNLSDQKLEKTTLLSVKEQEKVKLAVDKESQVKVISQLQQEEQKLSKELARQQAERKKIDREIEKVLAAEIRKSKTANKGTFKLAPEAKTLSDNFAANKGRLPWPVERGVITGRFGRQQHPVLKNITIDNNGIDIGTDREANVRAIFKGTVSSILVIPGAGKVVMLDHGAYRTVYTQLKEVYVTKGQKVNIKDALGKCLPGADGGRSEAHLEIWHVGQNGTERLNPSLWINSQ